MDRRPIPRRRSRSGSVVIETSLSFLAFAAMLFGAFDVGQFLFIHQALVDRARFAARWGVANDPATTCTTPASQTGAVGCDQIKNMVLYNQTSAGTSAFFNLPTTCTKNSNTSVPTAGTCAQYWYANTDNAVVTVTIIGYRYSTFSPYFAGSYTSPNIEVTVPVGVYD